MERTGTPAACGFYFIIYQVRCFVTISYVTYLTKHEIS